MKRLLFILAALLVLASCAAVTSYDDLVVFLEADLTDEIPYTKDFQCHDFAVTLFENAEAEGLEVGFVSVWFGEYDYHALNVFDTDEGWVFVDCSMGRDVFIILEVGNPYVYQYSDNGAYVGIAFEGKPIVEYRIIWDMGEWGDIWKPLPLPH